jgi:ubiquinone/menaquinone biosynthesis C-methylase UbiE
LSLMEYISTGRQSQPQGPQPTAQGADKYYGPVASGYDAKRTADPKWTIEQAHIESMLDEIPSGDWVVDVPCGTGRFFSYYAKRGLLFHGVDRSVDMLKQAAYKVVDQQKARLHHGDVRALPLADKSVDAAVMCRLTRWLSPDDCQIALRELQRVARKRIIFTARVRNHIHARSYELINGALDGWKIARDETGADLDYRIIALEPV